jgi:hypothetical protein
MSGPVASHRLLKKRELTTVKRPPRTNTAPPPPPSRREPIELPFASVMFCSTSRGVAWSWQCDVVMPSRGSHVFM